MDWLFYLLTEIITLLIPSLLLAVLGMIIWTVIKYKRGDFED